jgi:hypothetical protein
LPELFTNFPLLKLITGDALFAQRPLVEALLSVHGNNGDCDYLVRLKGSQPETLEAARHCLEHAEQLPPAAESVEKKGMRSIAVAFWLDLYNSEYIRQ